MVKVHVNLVDDLPIVKPTLAKQIAKDIINQEYGNVCKEDYFVLKYLDALCKLDNIKIEFHYNGTAFNDIYKSNGVLDDLFAVFEDIYTLDCILLKQGKM